MSRFVSVLVLGLLAAACSSNGVDAVDASQDVRISYRDYRSGVHLVLINDRYLVAQGIEGANFKERRANFYSVARTGALPKVCSDEIMKPLVAYFFDEGFAKYARSGEAPAQAGDMGGSLEMGVGGVTRHMGSYRGIGHEALRTFSGLVFVFVELHRQIRQYQNVEGALDFQQPTRPRRN